MSITIEALAELRTVTSEQLETIRRTWTLNVVRGGELGKAREVVLSRAGAPTDPGAYRWCDESEMWEPIADKRWRFSEWAYELRYACAKRGVWDSRFAALFGKLLAG